MILSTVTSDAVGLGGDGSSDPQEVYCEMRDGSFPSASGPLDRRAAIRFPIAQDVRYKLFRGRTVQAGAGKSINMSSSGILFDGGPVEVCRKIEVSVNWPMQLGGACRLKLVAQGRVVRCEDGRVAVAIERYEFRTQGSRSRL